MQITQEECKDGAIQAGIHRVHACPFCEEPRNTLKCLILQGLASFGEGKPGVIIYRKMVWFDAKSV